MPGNTGDPSQNWRNLFQENQAYRNEIRRLNEELDKVQRRQKVAVENAYSDGYQAGKEDGQRIRRNGGLIVRRSASGEKNGRS